MALCPEPLTRRGLFWEVALFPSLFFAAMERWSVGALRTWTLLCRPTQPSSAPAARATTLALPLSLGEEGDGENGTGLGATQICAASPS